jgi:hypothetical protein
LPVTLKNTAGGRKSKAQPPSDISAEEWVVAITLSQGKVHNPLGGIGMHLEAKAGKDDFDDITLPRFVKHLEFNNYQKEFIAPRFSKDVVPTANEHVWKVTIESNFDEGDMVLNWADADLGENEAQLIFHDPTHELKERYGFEVDMIESPTQDEMLVKIREYSHRKFKPQDQLMIFIAGHGQFDDSFGEGYLVAKNSLENDKAKSSYISHSNLRSYINNIPCEHILLTMDVCFGGTFDPVIAKSRGTESASELSETEYLVRKLSYRTRKYITSGGKEYVSDGVPGRNSPFAAKFLEALKSNVCPDRILTINEINSFLEKVKSNEPRSGDFGDGEKSADFVFVAKNN